MPPLISVCFVILLLPLLGFAIQIFVGRRLPDHGWYVPTGAILAGLALSLWIFFGHMLPADDPGWSISFKWEFIRIGDFSIPLGIVLDNITAVMLIVVTVVSGLVHVFSTGYMKDDPRKSRYFGYLGLFSFSMLWLVLSDNLLGIFVGWELVGLSSYLLIGFWFEKQSASDAGKKAFIVNRVGDLGFLLALMIVMWLFQTFDLAELRAVMADFGLHGVPGHMEFWLTLTGIGLFCGAVGKSAQFPLHVWLPDAMEGPTPVSALIHAATMVAAGVYLMIRIFFLLTFDASLVLAYVGGFTAFMSATIAVAQWDIKRVLAYSTVSQLGYMIMAVGVGAYSAGLLHLMTHAFFKACLFLGSGSVIHAIHHVYHEVHDHGRDAQDMRNMGGLRRHMPVTYWTFLLATLALAGVPLTSGFLSKDAILAGSLAFGMLHPGHWLLAVFGFGAAALTAFYMFRLIFLTFHGEYQGKPGEERHLRENKLNLTGPLIILSGLSVFFFYSPNPTDAAAGWFYRLVPQPEQPVLSVGYPSGAGHAGQSELDDPGAGEFASAGLVKRAFATSVTGDGGADSHAEETHGGAAAHGGEVSAGHDAHQDHVHHTAHVRAVILSVLIVLLSIGAAWLTYLRRKISAERVAAALPRLHRFLKGKWFFDELYHATAVRLTMGLAAVCAWIDRVIIDGIVDGTAWVVERKSFLVGIFDDGVIDGGVNGLGWLSRTLGKGFRRIQTGDVQGYLVGALVGVIVIMLIQVL